MRIWFASAIPQDSYGGVARSMRELSMQLSRRGHECSIIDNGIIQGNYVGFAFRLALHFALNILKPPDWIVGRSTDAVVCAVLSRLFRLKTRTVLHSHGWEEKAYDVEKRLPFAKVSPKTTWKSCVLRFPLLRLMLLCCDLCVCGTVEEARWLRSRYPRLASKIFCVPNGVTAPLQRKWSWTASVPPRFLCIGNATWKKNVAYAVKVFTIVRNTIPGAELFIVGCSPKELFGQIETSAGSGITAISREDPRHMSAWYETCPFYISTSLYEGGRSLAVLEAMSFGCVVFVSSIPSSIEFVRNRVNGIVMPSISPKEDASIIVTAVRSPALCATIGQRAFRFAERQSWARQARRWERDLCVKR